MTKKDISKDFGFYTPSYDNLPRVIGVSDPGLENIGMYPMGIYGIFSTALHLVDRASSLTFRPSEKYIIKMTQDERLHGLRLRFRMQIKHGFGCLLGTVVSHLPLAAIAFTNWSKALL
jgi:hypothetical protein